MLESQDLAQILCRGFIITKLTYGELDAQKGGIKSTIVIKKQDAAILNSDSVIEYHIEAVGDNDLNLLHILLNGHAEIVCQRCLNIELIPIALQNTLAMVSPGDASLDNIMLQYECIELLDGGFDLSAIIRDELVLSLPNKHLTGELCDDLIFKHTDNHIDHEKRKPFANLMELMK
jgi:uncharacterized metal-binding protein YceD (DUF177 family)